MSARGRRGTMKKPTRRQSPRIQKENAAIVTPATGGSRSTSANQKAQERCSRSTSANQSQRRCSRSTSANQSQRRCSRGAANLEAQKRRAETPPVVENSLQKRRRSNSSSVERPPSQVQKRIIEGRVVDSYCWICHKFGGETICSKCPRIYHTECFNKLKGSVSKPPVCKCTIKTIDGKNEELRWEPFELKKLLQFVLQKAFEEDKKDNPKHEVSESITFWNLFKSWPRGSENDNLFKIIDFDILLDTMNDDPMYATTNQFFLDVKWIYHNCCILHGAESEITKKGLKLEKNFKRHLIDMEACGECYRTKYSGGPHSDSFFSKVCSNPHPIIWAKLRGSPYWPAKCLKIRNDRADVRFFGTHDKSNILIDQCFHISRIAPFERTIKQSKYTDAMKELSMYITNYETVKGPFKYYPKNTPFAKTLLAKKPHKRGRHKVAILEQVAANQILTDTSEKLHSKLFKGIAGVCDSETVVRADIPDVHDSETFVRGDAVEVKVKIPTSVNNFLENRNNQNVVGTSENALMFDMTFTVAGHNGPENEINMNNSDGFMDSSSEISNPILSINSFNETSSLLSDTNVLTPSTEFMTHIEVGQNSVNFVNVNTSNSLPVITSAISASESIPIPLPTISSVSNNDETAPSASNSHNSSDFSSLGKEPTLMEKQSTLVEKLNNMINNTNDDDDDDDDDEIQVVGEERKKTNGVETYLKNPPVAKALFELLLANKPSIRDTFSTYQGLLLRFFLSMWVEINTSRYENADVMMFLSVYEKATKKIDELQTSKSHLQNEVQELKAAVEQLTVKKSDRNAIKEHIISSVNKKLSEENKELKKELSDCKEEKNHLTKANYDLKESVKQLEEDLNDSKIMKFPDTRSLETQTEEFHYDEYLKPNSATFDQSNDSTEIMSNEESLVYIEQVISSQTIQQAQQQSVIMTNYGMMSSVPCPNEELLGTTAAGLVDLKFYNKENSKNSPKHKSRRKKN